MLLALPGEKLGVVVFSNSDESMLSVMKIATEALTLAYETKAGRRRDREKISPVITLNPDKLIAMEGYYATPMGFSQLKRRGNKLKLNLAGINLWSGP